MRGSTDRILTTHVGALPMPDGLWSQTGVDTTALRAAVVDVVAAQKAAGVDFVNEGELTKGGNWVSFINDRLSGFQPRPTGGTAALLMQSKDWQDFAEFYRDAIAGGTLFEQTRTAPEQTRTMDWARCATSGSPSSSARSTRWLRRSARPACRMPS